VCVCVCVSHPATVSASHEKEFRGFVRGLGHTDASPQFSNGVLSLCDRESGPAKGVK
jgi:hypothetical protein